MRIAIIPARSKSKGIPGKNLKTVGGYSLLARAIASARDSGEFDRIVVSTDGTDIAEEAKRHGAELVLRPDDLSGDHSPTIDAVEHVLRTLNIAAGICVLLQPTSPLRSALDVKNALAMWEEGRGGSVVAVTECEHHPYKTLIYDEGELRSLKDIAYLEAPRQRLPEAYRVNGAVYVNRIEDILAQRSFFCPPLNIYRMPVERSLDIDNILDLKIANIIAGD